MRPDPAPGSQHGDFNEQRWRDMDAVESGHIGLKFDAVQMYQNHRGPPLHRIPQSALEVQSRF